MTFRCRLDCYDLIVHIVCWVTNHQRKKLGFGCLILTLFLEVLLGVGRMNSDDVESAKVDWQIRLQQLFEEGPIAFRLQNEGDYPDRHILGEHVATGEAGLLAHIRK